MEDIEIMEDTETEKITNPIGIALRTCFAVLFLLLAISLIFNVPLYFLANTVQMPLMQEAPFGFLEVWPFSYLGAAVVVLLGLMKYVSRCYGTMVCTWYLI